MTTLIDGGLVGGDGVGRGYEISPDKRFELVVQFVIDQANDRLMIFLLMIEVVLVAKFLISTYCRKYLVVK